MADSSPGYHGDRVESRVDVNTCLRLISTPIRRHLLRQLAERPDSVGHVQELVNACHEGTDREVKREAIEIDFRHTHLPALTKSGVVEYDEQSGAVRYYPTPKIEELLGVLSQWE